MAQADFPKYLMTINITTKFYSLREAAEAFDSGIGRVSLGTLVLAENFEVRPLQVADRELISHTANKIRSKK